MMKQNLLKAFLVAIVTLIGINAWADGVQSVKVTFNGTDNTNWVASSGGSIAAPVNGVATVTMAAQTGGKYRADLQYNTASTYTFDKTKDIVWAVKLTGAIPGTGTTKKFELQYKNSSNTNTWINGINAPSGTIDCTDGGVIYYFNLGAGGLNKLSGVQDGTVSISQIHFIFADAANLTAETAKYSVDWVGTFASVADLTSAKDWKDDYQEYTENIVNLNKLDVNNAAGYDAFSNAVSGATASDVLLVKGKVTATDEVNVDKNLTVRSLDNCSVSNTFKVTSGNFYLDNSSVQAVNNTGGTVYLVGSNKVTDGITLAKQKRIDASSATLDTSNPIKVNLANDYTTDAYAFVLKMTTETADAFTQTNGMFDVACSLSSGKYELKATKKDITNADKSKGYAAANFATAITDAEAGNTLTINRDITISAQQTINKNLTINGSGKTLTYTNSTDNTASCFSVTGVDSGDGYTLTLTNVKFSSSNTGTYDATLGKKAKIILGDANNTFPKGVYLHNSARVDANSKTLTSDISLAFDADYTIPYVVVLQSEDNTHFKTSNTLLELYKAGDKSELTVRYKGSDKAVFNSTSHTGYDDLASAVAGATAGDVLTVNSDLSLTSAITINKNLTINGSGKTLTYTNSTDNTASCFSITGVDSGDGYTLTLTNVKFSSSNTGTYDATLGKKAKIILGDANNTFPKGVYLHNSARVDANSKTLTSDISLAFDADYTIPYVVVQNSEDNTHFKTVDTGVELYKAGTGKELTVRYKGSDKAVYNSTSHKGYDNLADMIASEDTKDGDAVTLNADITLSADLDISKAITLSGNSKTITNDTHTFTISSATAATLDGCTVSGTIKASKNFNVKGATKITGVELAKGTRINVNGATISSSIALTFASDYTIPTACVIQNSKTTTDFTVTNSGLELYVSKDKEAGGSANEMGVRKIGSNKPVFNETKGAGYDNLADAIAAAESKNVLVLNQSQTISAKTYIDKKLTIKSATGAETITYSSDTCFVVKNYTGTDSKLTGDTLVLNNISFVKNNSASCDVAEMSMARTEIVGTCALNNGVFLNNKARVYVNNDATISSPIALTFASDYTIPYVVIQNSEATASFTCTDSKLELYKAGTGNELTVRYAGSTKSTYNETTHVGYDNLAAAIAAANSKNVLVLNQSQTISAKTYIDKKLTIKSATGAETITYSSDTCFVVKNYTGTDSKLTGDTLVLNNISFVKNNSASCDVAEMSMARTEIVGTCALNNGVFLNNKARVYVNNDATISTPIALTFASDYTIPYVVIQNSEATANFTCTDSKLELYKAGETKELTVRKIGSDKPVYNETKNVGYDNLASAIAAVEANDVLTFNADQTLTSAITIDKAITIKGNSKTITTGDYAFTISSETAATLNGCTVDGTITASKTFNVKGTTKITTISLAKDTRVNVNGATISSPITLTLASDYTIPFVVIKGSNTTSDFTMTNTELQLYISKSGGGENNELSVKRAEKPVTDETEFKNAISNATDGAIISIQNNMQVSKKLEIDKNITIKSNTGAEAITFADTCFVVKNYVNGEGKTNGYQLTLDNVKFAKNGSYARALAGTANNKVYLDVYAQSKSKIQVVGNCSITNGFFLEKDARIDMTGATTTEAIPVTFASDYADSYVCILNCKDITKFTLTDNTKELYVSKTDGNGEISVRFKTSLYPVMNTTTGTGYLTLSDAIANAAKGNTIKVQADMTIDKATTVDAAVTIDGNNKTITLSKFAGSGFVVRKGATIKNVTVDAGNVGNATFEFAAMDAFTSTLDSVTVKNAKPGTKGIYRIADNATVCLNGVVDKSVTIPTDSAEVYVAATAAACKIRNHTNGNYTSACGFTTVFLEKGKRLNVSGATISSPIKLILAKDYAIPMACVIQESKTPANFTLTSNQLELYQSKIDASDISKCELGLRYKDATKAIFNTTTKVGYDKLADAITAANEKETLQLNSDVTVENQIKLDKAITIDGNKKTINISNIADAAFLVSKAATVKNATICNNNTNPQPAFKFYNETTAFSANINNVEVQDDVVEGLGIYHLGKNATVTFTKIKNTVATCAKTCGEITVDAEATACYLKDTINIGSVHLDKGKRINVGSSVIKNPITVKFSDTYGDPFVCIQQSKDLTDFTLSDLTKELFQSKYDASSIANCEISVRTIESYNAAVTADGARLLTLPFDAVIPDGVEAYTLEYDSVFNLVQPSKMSGTLKRNTPVYIKAAQGTYTFKLVDGGTKGAVTPATSGSLVGCYSTITDLNSQSGNSMYILTNGDKGLGFYKANNSTVETFSAYMVTKYTQAPAFVNIDWEIPTETVTDLTNTQLIFNSTTVNTKTPTLEMTTVGEGGGITKDYVGLMSFTIPQKSGFAVKSATLKVVTAVAKGSMDIYKFSGDITSIDVYEDHTENILAARETTPVEIKLAGTSNKAVTDEGASNNVATWTNNIDITSLVDANSNVIKLLLTNSENAGKTDIKIYSKNATDVTLKDGTVFKAADLKPELTIVYKRSATAINDVNANTKADMTVKKIMRGGRIIIIKNGKAYNLDGTELQ